MSGIWSSEIFTCTFDTCAAERCNLTVLHEGWEEFLHIPSASLLHGTRGGELRTPGHACINASNVARPATLCAEEHFGGPLIGEIRGASDPEYVCARAAWLTAPGAAGVKCSITPLPVSTPKQQRSTPPGHLCRPALKVRIDCIRNLTLGL